MSRELTLVEAKALLRDRVRLAVDAHAWPGDVPPPLIYDGQAGDAAGESIRIEFRSLGSESAYGTTAGTRVDTALELLVVHRFPPELGPTHGDAFAEGLLDRFRRDARFTALDAGEARPATQVRHLAQQVTSFAVAFGRTVTGTP